MRLFAIPVICLLIAVDQSTSFSIRKHGNKMNSIPSDDISLWFSDHFEPKISETYALSSVSSSSLSSPSSSSSPSKSPSSSLTYDDEEEHVNSNSNSDDGLPTRSFSSSSSSSSASSSAEPRPVIALKNTSEAIPFTRVDATLSIDGFKESNPGKGIEEGVGPAVSFEYGSDYAESETGYSSSSSSSFAPEDENNFETGDLKIAISDLKPVYIKPPSGFKPVLYPNREMDGVHPAASSFLNDYQPPSPINFQPKVALPPPKEPYPYPYPFGLSSWTLGGIRGIERGGFWESMGTDAALGLPIRPFKGNPVSVVEWISLGDHNGTPKGKRNNYKPPLPPPSSSSPSSVPVVHETSTHELSPNKLALSPWIFGGLRQFEPVTWQMSPMVIDQVEYVPLPSSSSSSRSSTSTSTSSSSSSVSSSSSSSSSSSPKLSPNINSYWIISDNDPNPSD